VPFTRTSNANEASPCFSPLLIICMWDDEHSLQAEGAYGGRPDSDNHMVRSRMPSNDSFSVSPLLPKVRFCPHVKH